MTEHPKAIYLANLLGRDGREGEAADELIRLHELNTDLVDALKILSRSVWDGESFNQITEAALALAAEVITKAEDV